MAFAQLGDTAKAWELLHLGMTQRDCLEALGRPQSFMSDVERGVRRLDIIQIRDLCRIFGCDLVGLIQEFEDKLKDGWD